MPQRVVDGLVVRGFCSWTQSPRGSPSRRRLDPDPLVPEHDAAQVQDGGFVLFCTSSRVHSLAASSADAAAPAAARRTARGGSDPTAPAPRRGSQNASPAACAEPQRLRVDGGGDACATSTAAEPEPHPLESMSPTSPPSRARVAPRGGTRSPPWRRRGSTSHFAAFPLSSAPDDASRPNGCDSAPTSGAAACRRAPSVAWSTPSAASRRRSRRSIRGACVPSQAPPRAPSSGSPAASRAASTPRGPHRRLDGGVEGLLVEGDVRRLGASSNRRRCEQRVHPRERREIRPGLRRRQEPLLAPPLRRGVVLQEQRELGLDRRVRARAQVRGEAPRHAHARVGQGGGDGRGG